MYLKDIPWFNRPWTKIEREGVTNLDDGELIASIFIRGNPEENAIDMANRLLGEYNLDQFSDCSLTEIAEFLGGEGKEVKAFQIKCIGELFIRFSKLQRNGFGRSYHRAMDIFNKFVDEFRPLKKECLFELLLDTSSRIRREIKISEGTLDNSMVHPREVFKPAIKDSAHSIILVHNHPSGDPTPSHQDVIITHNLRKAGEILKIPLKDHVIIGNKEYYSFREEGKLT